MIRGIAVYTGFLVFSLACYAGAAWLLVEVLV